MLVKVKKNSLGYNGSCSNCNHQCKPSTTQPYLVYIKQDNKKGENLIACSKECATKLETFYKEKPY